jgi:hypothetical protein
MTEPFYITAILATFYFAMRLTEQARSQIVSQRVRLSALHWPDARLHCVLRQLFLLILPFILFWIGWNVFRQKRKHPWLEIALPLVIITAMIVPFTIFNYQRFGSSCCSIPTPVLPFLGQPSHLWNAFIPILPPSLAHTTN